MNEQLKNGGVHIGDGVYVKYDGYHLVLMANNPVTDRVYLDWHVRRELMRVIEQVDAPKKREQSE